MIIIIIITQFLTRHMSVKVWRNRRRNWYLLLLLQMLLLLIITTWVLLSRLFDRFDACPSEPWRPAVGSHELSAQSRHCLRQFAARHRHALSRAEQTTRRRETAGIDLSIDLLYWYVSYDLLDWSVCLSVCLTSDFITVQSNQFNASSRKRLFTPLFWLFLWVK